MSVIMIKLHTTTILPSVGKEYMCFQNDDKTAQADRCIKSNKMTKVIASVLLVDTFVKKYIVLKCVLQ